MDPTRVSMEVIVTIVSKLVYFTYLGDEINLLILGWNNPFTKYQQDTLVWMFFFLGGISTP